MDDLKWCIDYLKTCNRITRNSGLPPELDFRALMNITMPVNLSEEYYEKQDRIIKELYKDKPIKDVDELKPIKDKIYLWQGDITQINADVIVNAGNEKLLGCFSPLHPCIDNAIHSYAGLQVRRDLLKVMMEQGYDEPCGRAKITKAYNLPSKYIIHTVGPIASGYPTKQHERELYKCYISSLRLADQYELKSIVFCSISTGFYGYPIEKASLIALKAIDYYLKEENKNLVKIIFDVFSKKDYDVYQEAINKCGL